MTASACKHPHSYIHSELGDVGYITRSTRKCSDCGEELDSRAVPEPVSPAGAVELMCQSRSSEGYACIQSVVGHRKYHSTVAAPIEESEGGVFWDDSTVAAPIAPAAVSESGRPSVEAILEEWADGRAYGEHSHFIREWSKEALQYIASLRTKSSAEGDGWIAVTDADREETNGDCVGWECITDIEQLRKVLCVVSDERYAAIRQLKEKCQ